MALLEAAAGCAVDGSGSIDVPLATTAEAAALLPDGSRYVGLAPGATDAARCWPLDNHIALARWITAQGWRPVFLLGPIERDTLPRLRQEVPQALFPGCSESKPLASVELSLAVSRRLSAGVGHDTSASHLMVEAARRLLRFSVPRIPAFGHRTPGAWP